jgi:hypothetical protein
VTVATQEVEKLRTWWAGQLSQALRTGRGLIVESFAGHINRRWWPGVEAAEADGTEGTFEPFDLLVVGPLTTNLLRAKGVASQLLRAVTRSVARRRPVLVFSSDRFASLVSVSRHDAEP